MAPKLLPRTHLTNLKRLPQRRAVTIVAGFRCKDGMLICADREESSGNSKKIAEKLAVFPLFGCHLAIATAGSGAVGDLAVKRLRTAFFQCLVDTAMNVDKLELKHEQLIIEALTKIHQDPVWNNPTIDPHINGMGRNLWY